MVVIGKKKRQKKKGWTFRKKPLRLDGNYDNWNEVDWRALGYKSLAHFIGDVKRRVAEKREAEQQDAKQAFRAQQQQDAAARQAYHQLRKEILS